MQNQFYRQYLTPQEMITPDQRKGPTPKKKPGKVVGGFFEHSRGTEVPNGIEPSAVQELRSWVFPHDNITENRKASAVRRSAKVVQALRSPGGAAQLLSRMEIDHIVKTLSTNKIQPLPEQQILAVLHKQFSDDERKELYKRLSDNNSPACGGTGRKSLDAMLYNKGNKNVNYGFSDIVWVWLRKPKFKEKPPPSIPEHIKPFAGSLQKEFPEDSPFKIAGIVKQLMEHHDKVRPGHEYGVFANWLRAFTTFALDKNDFAHDDRTVGWLRPGSATFHDWEREWRDRMGQRDAARATRRDHERWQRKLEHDEKVRAFYDEYGEQAVVEVFGQEALDDMRLV